VTDAQADRCDFTDPPSDAGPTVCDRPAREHTVVDEQGVTATVALCDEHLAYVSDRGHVHYWYVDRGADGRSLIRMTRPHH
jgi:hypothetical protein